METKLAALGLLLTLTGVGGLPGAFTEAPARAVAGPRPQTAPLAVLPTTFFGGIQVNEPDHDRWAHALRAAGLDSVEVTLYARQQRWDGDELWYDREAPWVVSEIRAAKHAGLRVVLVMRVALEHGLEANRHLWHGMIWPDEQHLQGWFDNYRRFALWGARSAAEEGVDLLAVGNELSSLSSTRQLSELPDLYAYWKDPERVAAVRAALVDCAASVTADGRGSDLEQLDGGRYPDLESMLLAEQRVRSAWVDTVTGGAPGDLGSLNRRRSRYDRFWRDLIARVRHVYPGPLTYGANFDEYEQVGFWDALDYVGINAYFPLGRYGLQDEARVGVLRKAWEKVAAHLEQAAPGHPVVLLELGWTRWLGSTVRPYSYSRVEVLETAGSSGPGLTCVHWATQPVDPRERVAAMQALYDTVLEGRFPDLRGFVLWKLTTRPQHREIEPFAVLLQPGRDISADSGWSGLPANDWDGLDAAYLSLAGRIANTVQERVRPNMTTRGGGHEVTKPDRER